MAYSGLLTLPAETIATVVPITYSESVSGVSAESPPIRSSPAYSEASTVAQGSLLPVEEGHFTQLKQISDAITKLPAQSLAGVRNIVGAEVGEDGWFEIDLERQSVVTLNGLREYCNRSNAEERNRRRRERFEWKRASHAKRLKTVEMALLLEQQKLNFLSRSPEAQRSQQADSDSEDE